MLIIKLISIGLYLLLCQSISTFQHKINFIFKVLILIFGEDSNPIYSWHCAAVFFRLYLYLTNFEKIATIIFLLTIPFPLKKYVSAILFE